VLYRPAVSLDPHRTDRDGCAVEGGHERPAPEETEKDQYDDGPDDHESPRPHFVGTRRLHGRDHVGVAHGRFGPMRGALGFRASLRERFPRRELVHKRQAEQDERPDRRNPSEHRMHEKDDRQKDRHPRCIEHRKDPRPRQEGPNGFEIAQTAHRRVVGLAERTRHARTEDRSAKLPAHPARKAYHDIGPDAFERGKCQQADDRNRRQDKQRVDVSTAKHPEVITPVCRFQTGLPSRQSNFGQAALRLSAPKTDVVSSRISQSACRKMRIRETKCDSFRMPDRSQPNGVTPDPERNFISRIMATNHTVSIIRQPAAPAGSEQKIGHNPRQPLTLCKFAVF
jgi:hypothetical protein